MDNFKCRAEEGGHCKQWLRGCVSWSNCNLNNYGAPCPACTASSPLNHKQCDDCEHRKWKEENYHE